MTASPDLHWKRIIAGGIAPHAISVVGIIVAIVGYTVLVAFGTGSEPDAGSLQQFNTVISMQIFPVATILLTVVVSAWVVRRVDSDTALLHGFIVGVFAGLLGGAFGALDAMMAVRFTATVLAGVLGAKLEPVLFDK
ncbi:hypothetical protein SAMN05421858_0521 [Haladaptatus litoreus]|uniref:Uncharacterized protein n=1 Tax=Haladaptatus litoreus TaxID=553468 RepID=A0A1N6VXQ8_9EURY|nr:hypothetical protein [Haladaptatus litoreus]SIQ82416.1 hypothetical protein SAMN05421858_0521 [Haladaptatus litoreus]